MIRFMSLIRVEHESLSSARWSGAVSLGQQRKWRRTVRRPKSVAVDLKTDRVYVADPLNKRIQVFDSTGKFLTKWAVPEWGQPQGFEDLAIDSNSGRLYTSGATMNVVLMFDFNGNRIGTLASKPPDKLEGPSALALGNRKLYVLNIGGNRVSAIDL